MNTVIDPITGLVVGRPALLSSEWQVLPDSTDVERALSETILSASGWRKVFVEGGDEEDAAENVSTTDMVLAGIMAYVFAKAVPRLSGKEGSLSIALGIDSRPTGTKIAEILIRMFISFGYSVHYLFISAAPEVMAYSRKNPAVDAFAYVSASHNPIGHNGMKFGLKTGGVLSADEIKPLIEEVRLQVSHTDIASEIYRLISAANTNAVEQVLLSVPDCKKEAVKLYSEFSTMVVTDESTQDKQEVLLRTIREGLVAKPLGIVAELNGSARTLSIDKDFFNGLGAVVTVVNGKPRHIAHRIVPEGRSLDQCREELEKLHKKDPAYLVGYVPDNDGDRGNIVYFNTATKRAEILEAQEVFALACLAELSHLVYSGKIKYNQDGKCEEKLAVAVNDPTSMRVDEIVGAFGGQTFRAEVGEANVVNLAVKLRLEGYIVRILGEGSNGGNITHPSAVRDPLNTVASIVKLLTIRDTPTRRGLFGVWCELRGISYTTNYDLTEIINSLPAYTTTSAYEDRALLKIKNEDHARLKQAYETLFLQEWELKKNELANLLGVDAWEEINYEGIREIYGFGKKFRSGKERGGFKISLKNTHGRTVAYLWMRGSGTEPVFRVLVDVQGHRPEVESMLLEWHSSLIAKADAISL